MAAYELAVAEAADMIEIDLHLSSDREIMIHHDANLERLGGAGEIRDHTDAELAELIASPGTTLDQRIPTLANVLDAFGERMQFNLELKVGSTSAYEGMEKLALAAVRQRGLLPRMLFSSFYDGVLARLRALSTEARLAILVSPRAPTRILERAAAVGAEAINPEVSLVTSDLVGAAHAEGLAVYPYTEDDPDRMKRLLDAGVDGIITNHPARLREILEAREGAP